MAAPDNKRVANRLHHELPVAYRSVGSFLSDWATNISQGGLFINTRKPLPVGTEVKILIQLPGAAFPYELHGSVARVTEFDNAANMVPGMGIQFIKQYVQAGLREQIPLYSAPNQPLPPGTYTLRGRVLTGGGVEERSAAVRVVSIGASSSNSSFWAASSSISPTLSSRRRDEAKKRKRVGSLTTSRLVWRNLPPAYVYRCRR